MPPEISDLTSRELAVLDSLNGAAEGISQRELARRTGFSVGLVNAVIKRLVHTGYVKTSHLNKRQLEYLLTAEGFARTALRSYHYVVRTVQSYRQLRDGLARTLNHLASEGITRFYLHGDGELADLTAAVFEEVGRGELCRGIPEHLLPRANGPRVIRGRREAVLNTTPETLQCKDCRVVHLATELGNGKAAALRAANAAAAEGEWA